MNAYDIKYKVVVFCYGDIVGVDRRFNNPVDAIERAEQLSNECNEIGITFRVILEYKRV